MHNELIYKNEVYRKLIHLSSLFFPWLLWMIGKKMFLSFMAPILCFFILLDYIKHSFPKIRDLYYYFFNDVTRENEHDTVTGATWVFIGIISTVVLFNQQIAIISLMVLSISDSMASLIGIKYGKTKLLKKTLEGSFAFYLSTFLILSIFTKLSTTYAIISSMIITVAELIDINVNDNIRIPLTTAILLYLGGI